MKKKLPGRWGIRITSENREILIDWVKKQKNYQETYDKFKINEFVVNFSSDSSYQLWCEKLWNGYDEITFEEFKYYILKTDLETNNFIENYEYLIGYRKKNKTNLKYYDEYNCG